MLLWLNIIIFTNRESTEDDEELKLEEKENRHNKGKGRGRGKSRAKKAQTPDVRPKRQHSPDPGASRRKHIRFVIVNFVSMSRVPRAPGKH